MPKGPMRRKAQVGPRNDLRHGQRKGNWAVLQEPKKEENTQTWPKQWDQKEKCLSKIENMIFLNFSGSDMQIEGGQNTISTSPKPINLTCGLIILPLRRGSCVLVISWVISCGVSDKTTSFLASSIVQLQVRSF